MCEFFTLSIAKTVQASAKKVYFQFAECSLSYAKIQFIFRNGFMLLGFCWGCRQDFSHTPDNWICPQLFNRALFSPDNQKRMARCLPLSSF